MTHRRKKEAIRNFMQAHYSDQQLASLLAHARDGKLSFDSCCCFIGQPTADHALRSDFRLWGDGSGSPHYRVAKDLPGAHSAELAYLWLCGENTEFVDDAADDAKRRRILIPMVLAEMRRRAAVRQESPSLELVG